MHLTVTTLVHHVVADLLYQKQFPLAHFPELVDLATVAFGLGIPLSNYSFVEKNVPDWDFTEWSHKRHGFLVQRALSYASAIAAWVRQQPHPRWDRHLRMDIRQPMKKSLRYLLKTQDSFFRPDTLGQKILEQTQSQWLNLAMEQSASRQIVAVRHIRHEPRLAEEQAKLLKEKLRSRNQFIVLNTLWTVEAMKLNSEEILDEMRGLIDHPSDEVRSKAAYTLTILRAIDDRTVDRLTNMIGSNVWFVTHSAAFALSSLEVVPDYVLKPMNQGLKKALQNCEYGLIPHFVNAFNRWLDDPESYFKMLWADDSPELLGVALDTLEQIRQPLTQLQE
jgi:hypothetical protein